VEVQVPFIQVALPGAKIVPVVIGEPDAEICTHFGLVLAKVLKGKNALIVASSDLSHYPPYSEARAIDRQTLQAMLDLDPKSFGLKNETLMQGKVTNLATRACGSGPVMAVLAAAKSLGATRGVVVSYANSGDTSVGDEQRVVGYGAVVFAAGPGPSDASVLTRPKAPPSSGPLAAADKKTLLTIARETVHRFLTTETVPLVRGVSRRLEFPQGAFVTLREGGVLRGCIGHIPPDYPLARTVGSMAMEAAFDDPRFKPLQLKELESVDIEISVLTPMKPIGSPEEIVVGRDGVLMTKDGRSAVFLPQVATENKWGREELLENLCRKGGLPPGSWKKGASLSVFQAEVFDESQFR
jgi:AmmeMemoRadiSam system protein A